MDNNLKNKSSNNLDKINSNNYENKKSINGILPSQNIISLGYPDSFLDSEETNKSNQFLDRKMLGNNQNNLSQNFNNPTNWTANKVGNKTPNKI